MDRICKTTFLLSFAVACLYSNTLKANASEGPYPQMQQDSINQKIAIDDIAVGDYNSGDSNRYDAHEYGESYDYSYRDDDGISGIRHLPDSDRFEYDNEDYTQLDYHSDPNEDYDSGYDYDNQGHGDYYGDLDSTNNDYYLD